MARSALDLSALEVCVLDLPFPLRAEYNESAQANFAKVRDAKLPPSSASDGGGVASYFRVLADAFNLYW